MPQLLEHSNTLHLLIQQYNNITAVKYGNLNNKKGSTMSSNQYYMKKKCSKITCASASLSICIASMSFGFSLSRFFACTRFASTFPTFAGLNDHVVFRSKKRFDISINWKDKLHYGKTFRMDHRNFILTNGSQRKYAH